MQIRSAGESDLDAILEIHRRAFGQEDEAGLVSDICADASAQPTLSLMAEGDGRPLGHVLFSHARLVTAGAKVSAALLAPLAVVPQAQGRGVGGGLVRAGLDELRGSGVALVFVLGDAVF